MDLRKNTFLLLLSASLILLGGCTEKDNEKNTNTVEKETEQTVEKEKPKEDFSITPVKSLKVDHIHGLGYPNEEDSLYVAAHDGLKIHKDTTWSETTTNNHDYMGFQPVKDGFLSSGHPEKGSNLKNPLGLIRSTDYGKTLDKIAFYGESDFHFLAATYFGNTIYIINEHKNSQLQPGVFYSDNDGKTWTQSKLQNFKSDTLGMISVNPKNGKQMAIATRNGVFLSDNNGNDMKLVTESIMSTAVAHSETDLYYASAQKEKISLVKLNLETKAISEIKIPFLDYTNPITYIAINQVNPKQIAFTTYENDLYESKDGGQNWTPILKKGKA
ncbi:MULTISPECIES: F510_1955 family glycosylhydrolase [unclassified Bacillus (in: firmicutes)]|uniref:F510_1955 family glycosylhydrolase n=1 Tax=unclassified Bacillus (in: firmicutes) TaxID=185979 RepID=UPI0008DEE671|nr:MULTISPECIES: hypothetical protein [unclassified Bacillus (in: firmicutes)]SFA95172.1 Sortilin, neurotensin receptor 3 [Bacillus sp. UNCCL13]SFQ78934.1 Sortilin, neurotensin receptor 3 [Bacillus sp. cl95]